MKYYTNTCFRPSSTHSQERQKYTILLIVTDGMINDMDATKVQDSLTLCARVFIFRWQAELLVTPSETCMLLQMLRALWRSKC
jgi:hypothetical protein